MRHAALAEALGHPHPLRTYVALITGFDFDAVWVRARSRGRARAIVARSFEDAGYGSFKDGLQHVTSLQVADELDDWPLVYPRRGPEGLVMGVGGRP